MPGLSLVPIVDVWANPLGGVPVAEAARLFHQSHTSDLHDNPRRPTPSELVAMMDASNISQICLSSWQRPGQILFSNADVAVYTRAYPTRIFGIASVNLFDPVAAVQELDHYVRRENFKGLRVCIELDVPFLTQVGHTGPLCPSETGRPIPYIDEVALKFPHLKIVCGHIGYPWTQEMVAVAWKHENVYIDTSAYLPKYYPQELLTFANTTGKYKVMFGTNFPQLRWRDCVKSIEKDLCGDGKGLKDKVLSNFLGGNARRIFKLDVCETPADLRAKAML